MKTELKVKYLQFLLGKKKDANEGFTLIELLVVVIIIGVLAAIALPNLLGQVGKARESEAKNIVGALNRAQQAFYTERGAFATDIALLEVPAANANYYTFSVGTTSAAQVATGRNNANNGTRDYVGGVQYNTDTRSFDSIVCRATNNPTYTIADVDVSNATVGGAGLAALACSGNAEDVQ